MAGASRCRARRARERPSRSASPCASPKPRARTRPTTTAWPRGGPEAPALLRPVGRGLGAAHRPGALAHARRAIAVAEAAHGLERRALGRVPAQLAAQVAHVELDLV